MADLMSASSAYMDKNSCYNSQVYGQNYSSHCYYGNMEYLSSGVPHSSLNVPSVSFKFLKCFQPSITDGVHRNENFEEIIPVFSTFSNFFKKKKKNY